MDCFSYLISDTRQQHLASRSLLFERHYHHFDKPLGYLDEVLQAEDLFYEDFRAARFAMRGTPFHCCPAATLNNTDPKTLLGRITHIAATDEVHVDEIPGTDLRIIYSISRRFQDELLLYFESATLCHIISPLIWSALKRSRKDKPLMHIVVSNGWLEVIVVHGLSLTFANYFPWAAREDILYYMTTILEELEVDLDSLEIALLGSGYTEEIDRYLHKYVYGDESVSDRQVNEIERRLFDLLSVTRCGL